MAAIAIVMDLNSLRLAHYRFASKVHE